MNEFTFDNILALLKSAPSRTSIENAIATPVISAPTVEISRKTRHIGISKIRKATQVDGISCYLASKEKYSRIVDLCCGNGALTIGLADVFPHASVTGVDISARLFPEQKDNLQFVEANTHEYELPKGTDLVVSLHACGTLTDRVIDLAVQSGAALAATPCCYGLLRRERISPRSKAFAKRSSAFERVIEKASELDGVPSKQGLLAARRDAYRYLVLLDQAQYMEEHGYTTEFRRLANTTSGVSWLLFGNKVYK